MAEDDRHPGVRRETLEKALEEMRDPSRWPAPRLGPISPAAHEEACRLLGLPKGTALTEAQVMKAARIAMEHLFIGEERI